MGSRSFGMVRPAVLFAALLVAASARADAPPQLAPHHATYKLTLSRATGDKAPADANGMISYDFSGSACDGYATTFRQMTELQPADGESRVSDMRSATFEDGAAKQFRFNTQTTSSAAAASTDDLDGNAAKGSDGSINVALDKPEAAKATFKAALFPTEHLLKVIEAAQTGRRLLTESVYDGSDTGRIVYDTLAIIGPPIDTPAPEAAANIDALKAVRRWPVAISYFDQGKSDSTPNYILSFELYANGISRALKLDYGTFTLSGELADLKLKPASHCPH